MTTEPPRFLRLTRHFDAPPERVFDAWVNPAIASKWLFTTPADQAYTADLDPSTDGRWTITARRGGMDYTAEGQYIEVDRPRRLVFTFAMYQFSPNQDRITVEIVPDGAGSLLTFTQEGVDIAAELSQLPEGVEGGSEAGWRLMFDNLATAIA